MRDASKFLVWCGLTCMAGSEQRQCPCVHPLECQMQDHPDFAAQRELATRRLARYARNLFEEERRRP